MPNALAFRYARALADLATEADPLAIARELDSFEAVFAGSSHLRIALESPAVPGERKRAVVEQLAKELSLSSLVRRFIAVLINHRRVGELTEIREAFSAVLDERMGIVRAEVVSARPLGEAQQQELTAALGRLTGKDTRANFRVQEDLVGGVVARVGSTVYDGSIRGQLEALKGRLTGVGI